MGRAWTNKDERQYKHIKDSAKDRGKSTDRAEEIAARTVNKERREEGRTIQQQASKGHDLKDRTKDELYKMAKKLNIQKRSQMDKSQLVRAIQKQR